jgi:hypothetical protein
MFFCFCFVLFVFVLGTGFLAVQGQGPGSSSILFPLHYNNSMCEKLVFSYSYLLFSPVANRVQRIPPRSRQDAEFTRVGETKPTNQPTTSGFGSKPNDDWRREIGNGDGDGMWDRSLPYFKIWKGHPNVQKFRLKNRSSRIHSIDRPTSMD